MDNNQRFPGNEIHPTAVIGPNVYMGTGNYIGPYCVIGMPGEHREKWGEDKGVVIANDNKITGHVTIDAGVQRITIIGSWCMLMKHSHIGHDAAIHDDVTISCGAKIGGHTIIEENANIGLNAVIHQGHRILPWCMIAMGAVVTLKCQTREGFMYAGNPAVEKGRNKKAPEYIFEGNPSLLYPPKSPEKYRCGSYQEYEMRPNHHDYNPSPQKDI